ncbi:hypothetical protein LOD99_9072 [Oopsacas minuta]|uniref:Uncharacterized protein n=1 Tax=Oopsacas minuta TaxID=111878 RepID=A0AAV7JEJ6_9METZ|nr:hypothetical protein LOD99_9072 [Oopsacas minuta]
MSVRNTQTANMLSQLSLQSTANLNTSQVNDIDDSEQVSIPTESDSINPHKSIASDRSEDKHRIIPIKNRVQHIVKKNNSKLPNPNSFQSFSPLQNLIQIILLMSN